MRRRDFLAGLGFTGMSLQRDELVDIDGRRLHAWIWGSGTSVVVIDVGIGETTKRWTPVITRLSEQTRVCAYERAGYGESDGGPLPRTARQAAGERRTLLSRLSLPPR